MWNVADGRKTIFTPILRKITFDATDITHQANLDENKNK